MSLFSRFPLFSFFHTYSTGSMAAPNKVTAMPCQDFSQQILSHPGTLSIKMPERWQLLPFAIVLLRRQGDLSLPQQLPGIFPSSHPRVREEGGWRGKKGRRWGKNKNRNAPRGGRFSAGLRLFQKPSNIFWVYDVQKSFLGRQTY